MLVDVERGGPNMTQSPPPGWYADPDNPGGWRWWDGQAWGPTSYTYSPAPPSPDQAAVLQFFPPTNIKSGPTTAAWWTPGRTIAALVAALLLAAGLGVVISAANGPAAQAQRPAGDPAVVADCTEAAKQLQANGTSPVIDMDAYKTAVNGLMEQAVFTATWEMNKENVATCWRAQFDYFRSSTGVNIPTQPEEG